MNNSGESTKPNIILIMADDMGYSDIGCYGSEIATPHIDRLAEDGAQFLQMYNCARCCPSRASLLTGLYPHQAGIGHMVNDYGYPSYKGYLREDCLTIAEALKLGGYRTGLSGKWHVGGHYGMLNEDNWTPGDEGHPTPLQRGFDRFYGTLEGCGSFYNPHTLMEQDRFIQVSPDDKNYYYTNAISDKAIQMIDEFQADEDPFFLYVSYTAPHWPLHALPEDIDKYRGKYRGGWDELRSTRYEKMKQMGVLDKSWKNSPRDDEAPPWEETLHKEWEDLRMAVYAAQVDRMDQGIGRIAEHLEKLGIFEDTLIMFLSDNGGCAEYLGENGWIEDYVPPTRQGNPVIPGNDPNRSPGGEDTYMSYDLPWANASNTPFRLFKHWVHEGGIATPFIVHWPKGIVNKKTHLNEAAHVKDIMATCLEAAGVLYPNEYDGKKITSIEGESLVPLLQGKQWRRIKPLIWEHEGNCAVRLGDWKLVRQHDKEWELYDMKEDRTELHDLSKQMPAKVQEMVQMYGEWAEHCGVIEWNALLQKK